MAHSFKNYPAKPAFGVNRESINAGEYILRKKGHYHLNFFHHPLKKSNNYFFV